MALWDLYGRSVGRPCAVLWGARAGARVRTAQLVDLFTPEAWPSTPPAAIKVKVGRPGRWAEELAALTELAARHTNVPLRVDVNGAFADEVAVGRLTELAQRRLRIEFVEEPCSVIPMSPPVPVAVDESLRIRTVEDVSDVRAVVLKPTVLGGVDGAARGSGTDLRPS